jgi:hypothetical protein
MKFQFKQLRLRTVFYVVFGISVFETVNAENNLTVLPDYTVIESKKIKHPKEEKWIAQCKKNYKKSLKAKKTKTWLKLFNKTNQAFCTEREYVLQATVQNTSANTELDVKGVVTSASPNVTVIEGNVGFSDIRPNLQVLSVNNFRIRANKLVKIKNAPLNWGLSSAKGRVQALEDQGLLPKLDRSSEIQGPDVNTNGIRDDIDTYIQNNYPTAPQQTAAQQLAKVTQTAMLIDKTDLAAVKALSVQESRAINCLYARFDSNAGSKQPAAVVAELEAISTSTKPRLLAYLAYSKALDGTAGSLPEGDTCE